MFIQKQGVSNAKILSKNPIFDKRIVVELSENELTKIDGGSQTLLWFLRHTIWV